MKISNGKKLATLYKKDLAAAKFEALLIMGFIVVANLFLYYKARTSWPTEVAFILSVIIFGFVPLSTFFRAFSFIRSEWKENTVYFMMSLPTTGNTIFLSKLLALLTQLFILGIIALAFSIIFLFMSGGVMGILEIIKQINATSGALWEISKIGIMAFASFGLSIIIAFLSSVIGKLYKKYSGLITFASFIGINYAVTWVMFKLLELTSKNRLDIYMQEKVKVGAGYFSWNIIPNMDFLFVLLLTIGAAVLMFFATTAVYDRKVEL